MTNDHDRDHGYLQAKMEDNEKQHLQIMIMLDGIKSQIDSLPVRENTKRLDILTNRYFIVGWFVSNITVVVGAFVAMQKLVGN